MNYKKLISLFLIAALSVSFVACKKKNVATNAVVRKEATDYNDFKVEKAKVSKSETFEKDGVSVTVTGITYEAYETKIKLNAKNNTENAVFVSTKDLSINGFMYTESAFFKVEAGSAENTYIEISNTRLARSGISKIKDLEFVVQVLDELYNEISSSNVLKVTTDATSHKQEYDASGLVVYDKDNVKIVARSIGKSAYSDDHELEFYVENNRDTTISIAAKNTSVNGKQIDGVFVVLVTPGKKTVDTMVFYGADLQEENITKITNVSAEFHAYDISLAPVFQTGQIAIPVSE